MAKYYDRYGLLKGQGIVPSRIPFIEIINADTDIHILYDKSKMRMDMLSYKYYGDPNYGWLILQANPQYGGFEFSIDDGVDIRIPYPLDSAIQRYEFEINKIKEKKEI